MKTLITYCSAFILCISTSYFAQAQNTFPSSGAVGIGTDFPDSSSLLDVKSTTKGILVPRMTKKQRDLIVSPALGLLIYQTNNTVGFYYYSGTEWTAVSSKGANKQLNNLTAPTGVNVVLQPNANNSIDLGSSAFSWKDLYVDGTSYLGGDLEVAGVSTLEGNLEVNGLANIGSDIYVNGVSYINNCVKVGNYTGAAEAGMIRWTGSDYEGYDGATWVSLTATSSGPNKHLSNLTAPTGVNVVLQPNTDNTRDLGSSSFSWRDIYVDGVGYLGSCVKIGNYTGAAQAGMIRWTGIDYEGYNGTTWVSLTSTNGTSQWITNGSNIYYNAGNIGVGTSTPSAKLEVSGGDALVNGLTIGKGAGSLSSNTAIGNGALSSNTNGYNNTASGLNALYSNFSGAYNTANGNGALYSNSYGGENTASGGSALYSNTSGSRNTANGNYALYSNTYGSFNSSSGYQALYGNTTGSYNTANGYQALFSNSQSYNNTANGYRALYFNLDGYDNTANGFQALYSNTLGNYNTANGRDALYSNTFGNYNTANGTEALLGNSNGNNNTANGYQALHSNLNGNYNTASGSGSLYNNYGSENTANGVNALYSNTGGSYNTANGKDALYSQTNGLDNTANGYAALYYNTTGNANTALGKNALFWTTTQSNNTAIGKDAGNFGYNFSPSNSSFLGYAAAANGNYSNCMSLGYLSTVNADNKVRIGGTGVTVIEGQVNWSYPSDGRFKFNINENVKGLDFIKLLRPVVYNFDTKQFDEFLMKNMTDSARKERMGKQDYTESSRIRQSGFIAQEVEKAAIQSGYDFNGIHKPKDENDNYSLSYSQFVVPLVKAVQELDSINQVKDKKMKTLELSNQELQNENTDIKNKLAEMKTQLQQFDHSLSECCTSYKSSLSNSLSGTRALPKLEQNIPNPFNSTTAIKFYLPQTTINAVIKIYSLDGVELKSFNVNQNGYGEISIESNSFTSGVYAYSLIIDGKAFDTKQMILTK